MLAAQTRIVHLSPAGPTGPVVVLMPPETVGACNPIVLSGGADAPSPAALAARLGYLSSVSRLAVSLGADPEVPFCTEVTVQSSGARTLIASAAVGRSWRLVLLVPQHVLCREQAAGLCELLALALSACLGDPAGWAELELGGDQAAAAQHERAEAIVSMVLGQLLTTRPALAPGCLAPLLFGDSAAGGGHASVPSMPLGPELQLQLQEYLVAVSMSPVAHRNPPLTHAHACSACLSAAFHPTLTHPCPGPAARDPNAAPGGGLGRRLPGVTLS